MPSTAEQLAQDALLQAEARRDRCKRIWERMLVANSHVADCFCADDVDEAETNYRLAELDVQAAQVRLTAAQTPPETKDDE